VRVAIDAGDVPPMKKSWEAVEFKIFVQYGHPARAACWHEVSFVASARGAVDAVELPCDGEEGGEAANRPAKSRLEVRKKKMQFDKKHKMHEKDHGTLEGEINLVSPELTHASKDVRGEFMSIKREMFSMNYHDSLILAFNMTAQNHAQQQANYCGCRKV
jgi:hypothetical protein